MTRYQPHIYVLPEDDADRELANGFRLHHSLDERCIQVMRPSGGWTKVVEDFNSQYAPKLNSNAYCHVVLLIDFDNKTSEDVTNRFEEVKHRMKAHPADRAFVIGAWSEPEKLEKALRMTRETIGRALADECQSGEFEVWDHVLLRHNKPELMRMSPILKPILFRKAET